MNATPWARYVRRTSGDATGSEIEKRTGIRQSNISRWLNEGTIPQPAQAAKFAQAYEANVLEAFVAAGFLSAEEAGMPPRPEIDFESLVDDDPDLSAQAKIHLKNQYGLLKAASAHTQNAAARQLIEEDGELDDATKARLLARLDDPKVDIMYSTSTTVVEHPFSVVEMKSSRRSRTEKELLRELKRVSEQTRAYLAGLASVAPDPEAIKALNERLAGQRRITSELANEARHVFAAAPLQDADVVVFMTTAEHDHLQKFDLELTDEDRAFLDGIRVGERGLSEPADTSDIAIAAHDEDVPIAGEQESPTTP